MTASEEMKSEGGGGEGDGRRGREMREEGGKGG